MGTSDDWNVATLKTFLEERHDDATRNILLQISNLELTMERDRQTLNRRLDDANRYKETYQATLGDLGNRTLPRSEADARFSVFQEKLDTLNRVNWPLYSSFGGVLVSMIVGLWVIVGLKIDATNQPVVVSMEQGKIADIARDRSIAELRQDFIHQKDAVTEDQANRTRDISSLMQKTEGGSADRSQLNVRIRELEARSAGSLQADENSRTDRSQINERLRILQDNFSVGTADRKSNEATFRSALVEIETQFCGSDTVRNLMHANDMRVMAMLWEHAGTLGHYPTDNAFYPAVCNRTITLGPR